MNPIESRVLGAARQVLRNSVSRKFITGDGFRNCCDSSINSIEDLLDEKVSKDLLSAKSVFIKSDFYDQFIELYGETLRAKVIFVGNSDRDFRQPRIALPQSVRVAYFQNLMIPSTDRTRVIPIGVENLSLARNILPLYINEPKPFYKKQGNILIGPFSATHEDRKSLLEMNFGFSHEFEILSQALSPFKYSRVANNFRFIAAPRGNGEDTHRFWESLYLNSIPIVKQSQWAENIQKLKIPCVIVNEWDSNLIIDAVEKYCSNQNFSSSVKSLASRLWATQFNFERLCNSF